jgi:tRNA(fMet)-specific endonuclease VapC
VRYVLDTNAVSALMRGDPQIVERVRGLEKSAIAVPQPVLAEIEYGLARLPRSRRRTLLRARFEAIRSELGRSSWSDDVSARFGEVKAALERSGTRLEDFDIAIAAHALAHDAVLVSGDREHMSRVRGLVVEQWSGR